MAAGIANLSNIANALREYYIQPWSNMRDTNKDFMSLLDVKSHPKNTIDFKIRDMAYSPVWSIAEADMTKFLDGTTVAADGVGSATAFVAPTNHPFINASVTMRYNYVSVEVPGTVQAGATGSPASWVNVLKDETDRALEDLYRALNQQLLSTANTAGNSGKNLDGLGVLFNTAAGHSYAGVSTTTYPGWTTAADTTTTTLSIGAMQTMLNKVEGGTELLGSNSTVRQGRVKQIWTSPQQFTAYGNLLTGLRRYSKEDTLDGGFAKLDFYGHEVVRVLTFPSSYMIYYSGGIEYRELEKLKTLPKEQNIIDGSLVLMGTYSNVVFQNRTKSGLFNALV
jgi:hypothetical protein